MIWLIGNKGMLGTELSRHLQHAGLSWVGTDRVRCETRSSARGSGGSAPGEGVAQKRPA